MAVTRGIHILVWIGVAVLALATAVVVFVATFDWNRAKPYLNDKISREIGRPFAIRGDLSAHWRRDPQRFGFWPGLVLVADDIAVDNPDWTREKRFAEVGRLELHLLPLPLLLRRVTIPGVQVTHPVVHLEKRAARNNWTFAMAGNGAPSAWTMDVRDVGFDTARIALFDAADRIDVTVDVDPLGQPIPFSELMGREPGDAASKAAVGQRAADYAFGFKAAGTYNGARVSGGGKAGGVLALRGGGGMPFPLQADVRVGDVHVVLAGTLTDPMALGALDLHLRIAGDSMAHLYPLIGVTLPDTPPFETDGHLTAALERGANTFNYERFNGRVGGSDLHGDLIYEQRAPRPLLSGRLRSERLQFADLGPLIGLDTGDKSMASKAAPPGGSDAPKRPANGKVLPDSPFRTERWSAMDADVTLDGRRIVHGPDLPISDLRTHLRLDGGQLSLQPLDFGLAAGKIASNVALDGRSTPMKGEIAMHARGLKLRELLPRMKTLQDALGEVNADAALSARGNSVAALLGSSNGEARLLMSHGVVSRELMELAGLNVGNYVMVKLFGDQPVKINCAAIDFGATDGVMRTRMAIVDTDNALIDIGGTVDFAHETNDLDIEPHTKGLRIFSLRSPLYVKGTFAQPDVGVRKGPLLLRGGGAAALAAFAAPAAALLPLIAPSNGDDSSPCADLLSKMRAPVKAPPAKAAPAKKR